MEPTCAKTIRDNLEQVKSFGIKIADESKKYRNYTKIKMGDINHLRKKKIKNHQKKLKK